VNTKDPSLAAILLEHRDDVVGGWLERTLQTYPDSAVRFLSSEKDPFRNPVGCTLKEGLGALFDGLLQSTDVAAAMPVLDGIIRMRAVQDFSASQAVAFIFSLKQVIRGAIQGKITRFAGEVATLETRIDELALLAFDVFVKCRQRIYEIRANEAGRRVFLLEKVSQLHSPEPIS